MGKWKRMLAAAAAAALLAALAGCQSTTKDATVYVKGELDATYLGTFDQAYIDVVHDMTEADAKKQYENNVEWEAEILVESWLPVDMPTDAVYDRAEEVVAKIYSHAKYTVADAEKLKSGDLAVEVTVSPIEVIPLLTEDFMEQSWYDLLEANGVTTQEQLDALSDEEYQALDEKYALALLDELEDLIDDLTYGEDQVIMLQLKKDSDGYYSLVETGWQKLDEVMIDYSGTYAK
ncbi:hypothetical protein D1641_04635 [Colidextribacter sp. OB.20]|uniref:hypothetical protein n=1 Tax=Colidextribacter sp. OB.20 TaxID=2304568 RepID=UPI00136B75A4|nr:hypothetical protein [Colidextribacter sp. OB.20]NBI09306.1 hypothetical protein [Colidextribacter sp. OB.20]